MVITKCMHGQCIITLDHLIREIFSFQSVIHANPGTRDVETLVILFMNLEMHDTLLEELHNEVEFACISHVSIHSLVEEIECHGHGIFLNHDGVLVHDIEEISVAVSRAVGGLRAGAILHHATH